jgi:hypothetical protein
MLSTVKEALTTAGGEEVFLAAKASREVDALFVEARGAKAAAGPTRREARTSFIIAFSDV